MASSTPSSDKNNNQNQEVGNGDEKVNTVNIIGELRRLASEDPNKEAFIFWDRDCNRTVVTRGQVWERSTKCAAMLRRLGVAKGDIVCNTLPNSQERLITTYGVVLAGAVSMHGQMFLADGEDIISNLKRSQCRFIIVDPNQENGPMTILNRFKAEYEKKNTKEDGSDGTPINSVVPCLSNVISVVTGNTPDSWLNRLDKEETETFVEENISQEDHSFILTTSGATGFGKLVPRIHGHTLFKDSNSNKLKQHMVGKLFNVRSLGWAGGAPVAYPNFGITRVLVDDTRGSPVEEMGEFYLSIVEQELPNIGYLLPTDIELLLNALNKRGQPKLTQLFKAVLTGGSPVQHKSVEAIGRLCYVLNIVYGGTEFSFVSSLFLMDPRTFENMCAGLPLPEVKVKIVGEDGQEVPVGETGEIFIQSTNTSRGYLNDKEASDEVFLEDNWYRTFDIGKLNDKGLLFVLGRTANNISHKGFIHYPGWMESRIDKHPLIQKSIVLGIPDPVNTEDICLCITQKPGRPHDITTDAIKEFCKELFLTKETDLITPLPKYYLLFEEFPLNSNAKIDRMGLKNMALKRIAELS